MKDSISVSNPKRETSQITNGSAPPKTTPRTTPQIMTKPGPTKSMTLLSDMDNEDEEHKGAGKRTIIQALINAKDKLFTQRTSGQCLMIKNEVMRELEEIIQQMGMDADGTQKEDKSANNDFITRKELKAAI